MQVHIEQGRQERLLGSRPKVVIGRSDAVGGAAPGPSPAELWAFDPTDRDAGGAATLRPAGEPADGSPLVPMAPPPDCGFVLAAAGEVGSAELAVLKGWWEAAGAGSSPPIVRVATAVAEAGAIAEAPQVLAALLRAALSDLDAAHRGQVELSGMLYELRLELQQSRVAMDALQDRVSGRRLAPQLIVGLPPDGRAYAPAGGRGVIVQPLPVTSEGLAGFDLHAPARGAASGGRLRIDLVARDRDEVLGSWLPGAIEPGGWLRCWLPEALSDVSHELGLQIEWILGGESAPALSLADGGDWPEIAARAADGRPLGATLAMHVWGADPGMRIDPGPWWRSGIGAGGSVEFSLSEADLVDHLVGVDPPGRPKPDWPIVVPLHGGGFRLHPLGADPVAATFPGGCPAGAEALSAVVRISHPEAVGRVRFAMLAARQGSGAAYELITAAERGDDPRILGFSGWQTVPPDQQPHALSLALDGARRWDADLIFATRTFPGDPLNYSWADWLDVRLVLGGMIAPRELGGQARCQLRGHAA